MTRRRRPVKLSLPAIDPFACVSFMIGIGRINSWRITLLAPLIGGLILLACIVEDTVGELSDVQLLLDLARVFGVDVQEYSEPSFPLARDVASWFFFFVVCTTCTLLHRQWQLMRECIPGVIRSGAVRELSSPKCRPIHRILLLPRLLRHEHSSGPLTALIKSVNQGIIKAGKLSWLTGFIAVLLTVYVIVKENQNGLFRVVAPPMSSVTGHQMWLRDAYSSWWASTEHPFGLIVYGVMISVGLFAVLAQNIIGAFCVYIILCFPAVAELDGDWLNRDGCFGWTPIARVFRTTVWATGLHGLTISVILITLGIEDFPWVLGLATAWIIIAPLYLIVPRLMFGRMQITAQRRRIEAVHTQMSLANISPTDVLASQPFRDEIERINATRMNPLGVRRVELPVFIIGVILPVFLTTAQIFFSVRFGN